MSSTVLHIEDEDLLIELDDQAQVIETEATMEIVADPAGGPPTASTSTGR